MFFCKTDSLSEIRNVVYSYALAIWHGFPDIRHIKVNCADSRNLV